MKNQLGSSLLILAVGGLLITGAAAQTATNAGPGVYDPGHPRVNEVDGREASQQNRIANGVQDGQLNARQASHLEANQARIQNQENRDMAEHNGHLTKGEQRQINREQNRQSRQIYRDKNK
jgi:hypothetical protein